MPDWLRDKKVFTACALSCCMIQDPDFHNIVYVGGLSICTLKTVS